MKVDSKQ